MEPMWNDICLTIGQPECMTYAENAATGKLWNTILARGIEMRNGIWTMTKSTEQQESHTFAPLNTVICMNLFSIYEYIFHIHWIYLAWWKVKSEPKQLISKQAEQERNDKLYTTLALSVNKQSGRRHKIEMQIRNWSFEICLLILISHSQQQRNGRTLLGEQHCRSKDNQSSTMTTTNDGVSMEKKRKRDGTLCQKTNQTLSFGVEALVKQYALACVYTSNLDDLEYYVDSCKIFVQQMYQMNDAFDCKYNVEMFYLNLHNTSCVFIAQPQIWIA